MFLGFKRGGSRAIGRIISLVGSVFCRAFEKRALVSTKAAYDRLRFVLRPAFCRVNHGTMMYLVHLDRVFDCVAGWQVSSTQEEKNLSVG